MAWCCAADVERTCLVWLTLHPLNHHSGFGAMEGCWTHHPETDEPVFREEKVGSEKGLAQSHKAINLEEWGIELRTVGSKFYAFFFWIKLYCIICDWTLCFSESCYNKFQTSCVHEKASPTYFSLWNLIFLTLAKPPMVETAGSPWTTSPPSSSQIKSGRKSCPPVSASPKSRLWLSYLLPLS